MAEILFVGNNPGGIKALLPVMDLAKNEFSVRVLTTEQSAPLFQKSSLPLSIIKNDFTADETFRSFKKESPKILVTGTSLPSSIGGMLENFFRNAALKKNIPSLCILDHWCNYAKRFSTKENTSLHFPFLPDLLCVMDKRACEEAVKDGLPANILRITGQPAFDVLLNTIRPALKTPGLSGKKMIGFVSEPIRQDYETLRGYDQETVLSELATLITEETLLVKKHPRENHASLTQPSTPWKKNILFYEGEVYPYIAQCDALIGMTSILLMEASLLGKPVLSYQPKASPKDSWYQSVQPLPVATNKKDLVHWLHHPENISLAYHETHASNKVLAEIRNLLSQKKRRP